MIFFLLSAGVITLLNGIAVVVGQRIGIAGKYFFATTVCGFLWALFIALFLSTSDPLLLSIYARVYYASAAGIVAYILMMAMSIGRGAHPKPIDILALIPYGLFSLLIIFNEGTLFASIEQQNGMNAAILHSTGLALYVGYFVIYYIAAVVILFLRARNKKYTKAVRMQSRYVLYAYGGAALLAATFNLLLPALGNNQLIWIGPSSMFVFIPLIYFSISRYGLFNIRVTAVRTFAYALSLAVMAVLYFLLFYTLSQFILKDYEQITPQVHAIYLFSALVLALFFAPVKRFFDKITDKIFFRGLYKKKLFMKRLGGLLTSGHQFELLLKDVLSELMSTLKVSGGLFIVYDKQSCRMSSLGYNHRKIQQDELLELRDFLEQSQKRVILLDVELDKHYLDKRNKSMYTRLSKRGARLVLPLYIEDSLLGVIILGEQQASGYTKRDADLMDMIADEIAIAVQHSLGKEEIQQLNASLEARIDKATEELRTTNARLRELDETKDEFMSMASHQLRTPLTSIKGYLSMVLDGDAGKLSQDQHKLLGEAFSSSERMVHLIGDFLNVSRLQTGKFVIDAHPTNLADVVEGEVESIQQMAKSRNMTFVFRKPTNIPVLYLDEDKLRQVIMNFFDNAIYYSPDSSEIRVRLYKQDGEVIFEVKDKGIGVPQEVQERLFTKFFRADNARKQRPDGTGIGLYLAKRVITQQGGDILFNSVPGKGSTFGFRLPIAKLLEVPNEVAE